MSPRRSTVLVAWISVCVLVAALLVGGGVWLSRYVQQAMAPGLSVGCLAQVSGATYRLDVDQTANAALITAISLQRGLPARAASIGLATAMQESRIRNIDYGDLDSVGLFQQRPSQGWGTVEQIMDPVYSAHEFYKVLEQVPNYVELPVNDAAQIVQRSGYPHAYAQHEGMARAFASALSGQTPAALSCTLEPATAVSTPAALEAAADTEFGPLPFSHDTVPGSSTVRLQVTDAQGWAVAQWAVARAADFGVQSVAFTGQRWDRDANAGGVNRGWSDAPDASSSSEVVLTMAAP